MASNAPEMERAPSDQSTANKWKFWKRKEKTQGSAYPRGPTTHDGARSTVSRRPRNVILFGETGVGKSSVINLIAGDGLADTSPNLEGCTLEATDYWFSLSREVPLHIYDTVGLDEPEMSINSFLVAIEKAHKLIKSLHDAGGVDLLLFCIRGGRITTAMQRSYRLFYEILCESHVPIAVVVTNLEQENVMEDWWARNAKTFQQYDIHPVAHACITAVPAHISVYAQKRAESRKVLRNMLLDILSDPDHRHDPRDPRSWFTAVFRQLQSFLTKKKPLEQQDLSRTLETRCMFSHRDAEKLAQILTRGEPEEADWIDAAAQVVP